MKNKLIFVQWTNNFGGLEKITQAFERLFNNYNPLVIIIRYNNKGLTYKNFFSFKKKSKLIFIKDYFTFIRKRRESIFHIQYAGSTILFLTYLAGAKRIVFHFHGTKFPTKPINKFVWKLLEKKVKIIANSAYTQNRVREKLNIKSKIETIPNLINVSEFNFTKRKYDGGVFKMLYAGRFSKGKNLDLIIDAAKELLEREKDFEFLLVGDGPEKLNIEKKIKEYSLNLNVKTLPFTNEIKKNYYNSHLFIFTSGYESFGNVVAEAVLSGLPVLCYKIPSLTELINDDFFLVERPDPKVFADKIISMKNDYEKVNEKLIGAQQFLKGYLDNRNIASKLESIYHSFD